MFMAVAPVTDVVAPVSAFNSPPRSRMSATRSSVSWVCGPLAGITVSNAVSRSRLNWGGVTMATSSSEPMRRIATCAVPCGSDSTSSTTTSGPFRPGPKPLLIRSYALCCVESGAAVASVGRPSRMSAAGTASTARPATVASSITTRRRERKEAHRSPAVGPGFVVRRNPGTRPPSTLVPAKPSTAGSSVMAMSTATATVAEAASPIWPRMGMPTTVSPASAMMTVSPANTTAEPAVPTAVAAASSGLAPLSSSERWRDTMNSA